MASRNRVVTVPTTPGQPGLAISFTRDEMDRLGRQAHSTPTGVAVEIEQASLRRRMLLMVAEHGPFVDAPALLEALQNPAQSTDLHSVVHMLYALNKSGLVKYRLSQAPRRNDLRNIEATRAGMSEAGVDVTRYREVGRKGTHHGEQAQHRTDGTDFRNHLAVAKGGPVTVTRPPVPARGYATETPSERPQPVEAQAVAPVPSPVEAQGSWIPVTHQQLADATAVGEVIELVMSGKKPPEPEWPVLAAIRVKVEAHDKALERADLLEQAAMLADEAEGMALLEMAERARGSLSLTEIEQEYRRFANWHATWDAEPEQ